MRSRYNLLILLVFLGIAAIYFLLKDPWSTTASGLEGLVPKTTGDVQSVRLTGQHDTLHFSRHDTSWLLEGELMNREAVENLLYATERMAVTAVIPVGELAGSAPDAEVKFFGKKRVLGHFLMYRKGAGTVLLAPGAQQALGVELQGFEQLPFERVYSLNADHYRRHVLLDLLPAEIRMVSVEPLYGTAFVAMQDTAGEVTVTGPAGKKTLVREVNERRIRMLFSYFNAIRYERRMDPGEVGTQMLPDVPDAVVQVESFTGRRWAFSIYQWIPPGEEAPDLFRALVQMNGDPGYLLVNYQYLDLLIRGLEDYGYDPAVR